MSDGTDENLQNRAVAERERIRELAALTHRLEQALRERDELRSRLMHAEADAEQAIHNEAFTGSGDDDD